MSQGTGCRCHEVYRVLHYSLISAMLRVGNESVGVQFRDGIAHPTRGQFGTGARRPITFKLIAAVVLLPLLAVQPATAAVFGSDGRVPLPTKLRALGDKIGVLVNAQTRQVCTAFCVSDRVIGTAGHCVIGKEGQSQTRLSDFWFRLGMADNKSQVALAETGGAGGLLTSDRPLTLRPPIAATSDWAFVLLDAPACKAGGLKIAPRPGDEIRDNAKAGRVYQVGFHRDFGLGELADSGPCPVKREFASAPATMIEREFANPEHLLLHHCATGAASSGAPLLIDGADGPEVVGIGVGTYVISRVALEGDRVVHRYSSDPVANTAVSATAFAQQLELFLKGDARLARGR